jgi:microcystin-dependent protein
MSEPFVGEIKIFAGNFAPAGWMFCQGQLLPISENETLFNLIGTTYGGDGQSTFGLPALASRVPMHMGQGPGLSQNYQIGELGGVEQVTLSTQQIPVHSHNLLATTSGGSVASPSGNVLAMPTAPATVVDPKVYGTDPPQVNLNPQSVTITGGSQPHDNFQPTLAVNFIISLFGIFPTQN